MGLKKLLGPTWGAAVHIVYGLFCSGIHPWYPALSISLGVAFFAFEGWEAWKTGDLGWQEFWEFMLGAAIGAGVIWILTLTGVI